MKTKFNTNVISRKMDKHGLLDQLPLYRMNIKNQVPYLGDFPHTPLHLYVRKEGEEIVEIKLLESPYPGKTDKFIDQLQEKSGIQNLKEKIKFDYVAQFTKYLNMQDLDPSFNFDFDAAPDYKMTEFPKRN